MVDNPFFDEDKFDKNKKENKKEDVKNNLRKLVRYDFVVQFAWLDTEAMKQEQQNQNAGDDQFAANNP